MIDSAIPTRFPIPWGNSAGPSFIRTIPTASQIPVQAGAASLTDGFPPDNFTPVGAGGTPPFGQDFNGILNQITKWQIWNQAGAPIGYDATFSTSVGGYPAGAILASNVTLGLFWMSTVDNNTSNPDSGGSNWVAFNPASPGSIRTITSSANVTLDPTDNVVGFNRSSSPAALNATLPTVPSGKFFKIVDLANNFNAFPITVILPGGQTFPAGLPTYKLNVNRQAVSFRYFGGTVWSIEQ